MRKRIALIGLGVLGIALGAGVWFLTRPRPAPLAPIDYEAELLKLALKSQPGDPSAENGWPELVEVATAVSEIGSTISNRESDADQTLSLTGREAEVEPWSWDPFAVWGCKPRTPRDDRITAEVWHRVEEERILERLAAALGHDVFIMDFDERLGAQIRTNWGNVQSSTVPSRVRTLSRMLTGLTERAMEAGNWEEARARIQDQMALARAAGVQPDAIMSLIAAGIRQMAQQTLQEVSLRHSCPPRSFLEFARDSLRAGPMLDVDRLIEVQQLEAKEMIDVSADMMSAGGPVARATTALQGWTPTEEARRRVDAWGQRIRAMQREDPRTIQADIAAVLAEIATIKGIHSLGLTSMSGAARMMELSANQRRQQDVFEIIIALALHTSAHGTPPQTLDALVPEFLAEVPTDPWAPDGKYRYIPGPTMGDIVLYTVGWDGEDNGGTYVPRRAERALTPEGKGQDYVFTRDECKDRAENPEAWEQP